MKLHSRTRSAARRGVALAVGVAATAVPLCAQIQLQPKEVGSITVRPPIEDVGGVPTARGRRFVVKATFPLPIGAAPWGLKIVDDDNVTPIEDTQVEVVSRRADGEPDVVEVIARTRNLNGIADDRQYRVIANPYMSIPEEPPVGASASTLLSEPNELGTNVQALLADPLSIIVRAFDPLGKEYRAYPLRSQHAPAQAERWGTQISTARTFEVMECTTTPLPNQYPHLFNLHSYLPTQRDDFLLLDLVFSNGSDGWDAPTNPLSVPLGKMYFDRVELLAPEGFVLAQQFPDPLSHHAGETPGTEVISGTTYSVYPIVKPESEDEAHVMGCAGQFLRRLVLYHDSATAVAETRALEALDRLGQGFATAGTGVDGEWWSWWNVETSRYFPQRGLLPDLDPTDSSDQVLLAAFDSALTSGYANLRDDLLNGTALNEPGASVRMGWAHPYGESIGYGYGGQGIYKLDGLRLLATKSFDGLRYYYAQMRTATERMPNALIGSDGEPTRHEKWIPEITAGLKFDMDFLENAKIGEVPLFCPTPGWDQNAVVSGPTAPHAPSYESALLNYSRWDQAHLVRYTRMLMTLAWIANDPVSKDELRLQSELFRFMFTEVGCQGLYCDSRPASLRSLEIVADAHPGRGIYIDRRQGWGLNAVAGAFALEDDDFRVRMNSGTTPWLDKVVEVVSQALMDGCDLNFLDPLGQPRVWGMISAAPNPAGQQLDGSTCDTFWDTGSETDCPGGRVTWHEMILNWGLRGLLESALVQGTATHTLLQSTMIRSITGLVSPASWNEGPGRGVFAFMPTRPHDLSNPMQSNYPYAIDSSLCPGGTCTPCPSHPLLQTVLDAGPAYQPHSIGNTDFYWLSNMVYAYTLTGDTLFLERPIERYSAAYPYVPLSGSLENQLEALLDEEFSPIVNAQNNWLIRVLNGSEMYAVVR
jgi:hypothetical protein